MMHGKILVYGFGPYAEFSENITEAIIGLLKGQHEIVTESLPVKFSRAMFNRMLKRHSPGIIIGLGQHRHAHKLRLERKAVNLRGIKPESLKPISRAGPPHLFVNLRLPGSDNTTIAYNAGTNVCNFSMYLCLEYCQKTGSRFAFVHVPKRYDAPAAAEYIRNAVHAVRAGTKGSSPYLKKRGAG